jgi:hypothetical protein
LRTHFQSNIRERKKRKREKEKKKKISEMGEGNCETLKILLFILRPFSFFLSAL